MAKRAKHTITYKPAGYQGYLDQKPIKKPNVKAIMILVASIFACGVISAGSLVIAINMMRPAPADPQIAKQQIGQTPTLDASPVFVAVVSSPQATNTPEPTIEPTQTHTPYVEPTDNLEATVEFMATQIHMMGSATAQIETTQVIVTATPQATDPPDYPLGYARITYNNVIVRSGSTRNSRALSMVFDGAVFGILDTRAGWVRIDHDSHETAWIADHLLVIEASQP